MNAFGGTSVAYADVCSNAKFQGLNCSSLNVTIYVIILPTINLSAPTAGCLGYMKPKFQFTTISNNISAR